MHIFRHILGIHIVHSDKASYSLSPVLCAAFLFKGAVNYKTIFSPVHSYYLYSQPLRTD